MYHYYFSELFHNIHDELILEIFHSDFERSDHRSEKLIFVTWAIVKVSWAQHFRKKSTS